MKFFRFAVLGLGLLLPTAAFADFQYQETTQITGGSMMSMMKLAGAFSRQAKQITAPTISSVYVQGNRMARVNAQTMEIIDLDKETITNVDLDKHTYTQMTFEEMRQRLQQAMQQLKQQQPQPQASAPPSTDDHVDVKFVVNVRQTGATKLVDGLNTSESIMTMQMVGTDTTNGQQGAFAITNDMWFVPDIPGYQEMREFYKRMGEKMGDMFAGASGGLSNALAGMQPAAAKGMSDMVKEVSKLKGIPVQQVTRMGATANGDPLPAASEAPLPPPPPDPQMPSAKEVAQDSATSAIASKLGGFGFGGFGHKKQAPPPPPPDDSTDSTDGQQAQAAAAAMVLMESTTQMASFSSAPIDSSKFAIPAGFTEIQQPPIQPTRQ